MISSFDAASAGGDEEYFDVVETEAAKMKTDSHIDFVDHGGRLVVFPRTGATADSAYTFVEHIRPLIVRQDIGDIVVDLSEVEMVDSTTLGSFVQMQSMVKATGGRFILCNVPDVVRRILEDAYMDDFFKVIDSPAVTEIGEILAERVRVESRRFDPERFILDIGRDLTTEQPDLIPELDRLMAAFDAQVTGVTGATEA